MNNQGLYDKFHVTRTDGRHAVGEKHEFCSYFVLDLTHDKHAMSALIAYANSCQSDFPLLSADLRAKANDALTADNEFVTVPDVTLPGGQLVPSFKVGKFLSSKGPMDVPQINAMAAPWVRINYQESRQAAEQAGMKLITELQALAIAHDIANQGINWSGGAVGEGHIFQGLHKGTVSEAQHGDFVSDDADERRWHQLSNGERIFDFAGNAYTWVFDNVQGDEQGLVAKKITLESPSIAVAPFPSRQKGMGWRPASTADGSGSALLRGGYWDGEDYAGVFFLGNDSPDYRYDGVGFRCTK